MKPLVIFAIVLLVTPVFLVQAQSPQGTANLDISTIRWNKSALDIQIIEASNESWWQPEFLNATTNTLANWKSAIDFFTEKYPDYSYLSSLTFDFTVSQQATDGYDVYFIFAQTIPHENNLVLGRTTTYPTSSNNIDHCVITLATTSQTLSFNTDGMMNVAMHEFGHALGLGHSNSTDDLMYPSNDLIFSENQISTLDLYGLAILFNWLNEGSPPTPQTNTITLPADIVFEYAPVSKGSPAPQDDPLSFLAAAVAFVKENTVTLLIIAAAICFLVALAIVLMTKMPRRKL
ncbi:MAG: matrixin family metalloprotease [Candidatus Bathyarchaeota archaeon]|nr:matrixin family metalloprotease [Candidatus Bathyarchaeota archaeon]